MKRSLQLNPGLKEATWEQIKYWRDKHEVSPVTVTGFGEFDCDPISEKRMQDSVSTFASLPTVVDNKLTWKLADNSLLPLTKAELEGVLAEMLVNRAVRASVLHVKAEVFNTMTPKPTLNQIQDLSYWFQ